MEHEILLVMAGVAVVGVLAQWLSWYVGVPAIVVLLAAGAFAGPVIGFINPGELLGDVMRPAIGLAVAIIVFEGGLNLDFRELRLAGSGVARLIIFALPLNWLLGAVAGHYIAGLSWPVAVLLGAILTVTGPTVIMPLLRQAKLNPRTAAYLKWEGIVNDPIGATLTLLVLSYLLTSTRVADEGAVASQLALRAAVGCLIATALGTGMAYFLRFSFHRDLAPEFLKTPILIASALGIYAAGELIQPETGLVGATLFGIVLANIGVVGLQELRRFHEALTVFIVSGLFILLTASIEPKILRDLSWSIALTTSAILFVVRPLAIFLATIGSAMNLRERLLVGWIGPRGVVAAAVAGIAGTQLAQAGFEDARLILPLVFSVIAATVILHGFTLGPLARRMGLASSARPGLLIVGATPWTIRLAQALLKLDVPVILSDRSPEALAPAREAGVRVFRGEVLSPTGEEEMDLQDVAYLLAATDDDAYNALVSSRFTSELGRERVHQLAPNQVGGPDACLMIFPS
ncbi:cation:proton antiporter [Microvirga sp. GCM10011540]|uniref:cation:proton antiporter n=1 Tax=Microvirga sp. GCM10011540 TaxID=3317338 RepID=UPI003616C1B1